MKGNLFPSIPIQKIVQTNLFSDKTRLMLMEGSPSPRTEGAQYTALHKSFRKGTTRRVFARHWRWRTFCTIETFKQWLVHFIDLLIWVDLKCMHQNVNISWWKVLQSWKDESLALCIPIWKCTDNADCNFKVLIFFDESSWLVKIYVIGCQRKRLKNKYSLDSAHWSADLMCMLPTLPWPSPFLSSFLCFLLLFIDFFYYLNWPHVSLLSSFMKPKLLTKNITSSPETRPKASNAP